MTVFVKNSVCESDLTMTQKLLFFDVDGTLVGFDGIIPESTWTALRKAREKGHLLFICTGRSRHQIYRSLLDFGFDGIVGATGGYVEYRGQVLSHQYFGEEKLQAVLDCFKDTGTGLILQGRERCISSDRHEEQFYHTFRQKVQMSCLRDLEAFYQLENDNDIHSFPDKYPYTESILYCDSPLDTQEVRDRLPDDIRVEPASFKDPEPTSGEITLLNQSKGTGIRTILDHLGKTREDVIGFGDGANDLEMLDLSGISVVMGNGSDRIKAHASYVTDAVEDDGIYNAMEHLKLI